MLSVWIDFGLEMHGLTMRVPALANVHVKKTTRPTFKLINLLFGKFVLREATKKPHRMQVTISLKLICVQMYYSFLRLP